MPYRTLSDADRARWRWIDVLFFGKGVWSAFQMPITADNTLPDTLSDEEYAELERLLTLDVFADPDAEWLYAVGVEGKALLARHESMQITRMRSMLYSRLLTLQPLMVQLATPLASAPRTAPAPEKEPVETPLTPAENFIGRLGLGGQSDISADQLLEELKARHAAAAAAHAGLAGAPVQEVPDADA